jgi:hypothetical protein
MIYLYCPFLVLPNTLLRCFLCLGYRQQIDWGNGWNDSFIIFVIVIHGYPHDMDSNFAVHQTLFWFRIYIRHIRPHLSCWAMFNLDLPIVIFFALFVSYHSLYHLYPTRSHSYCLDIALMGPYHNSVRP